jgi:hypothetical protein
MFQARLPSLASTTASAGRDDDSVAVAMSKVQATYFLRFFSSFASTDLFIWCLHRLCRFSSPYWLVRALGQR